MINKKFIGIVGSLRKGSYNRMLMSAFQKLVPPGVEIEVVEIGDFPLYNQDIESSAFPQEVQIVKDKIKKSDGVLIATAEYNRSIPGVLKNAIDWVSRPNGTNSFVGKKILICGASIGSIGTAVAQSHLKQILLFLDTKVLGQPEFYLGLASQKFNEQGDLIDQNTADHIQKIWNKFMKFCAE